MEKLRQIEIIGDDEELLRLFDITLSSVNAIEVERLKVLPVDEKINKVKETINIWETTSDEMWEGVKHFLNYYEFKINVTR